MMNGISLSLDYLIKLRSQAHTLKLTNRQAVKTNMMGSHQSALRGRGIDFDEVRTYQAGDDIRNMDWRVTARTGKPHIKLYHEERERPVYVVVDLTPTMFFGTKVAFKSAVATETAALIAWAAVQNGDRLGAIVFHSVDVQHALPPKSRQHGVLPLLNLLANQTKPHQTQPDPEALTLALSHLRHVAKPGSLIFLISDFFACDQNTEHHLSQLSKHTEMIAITVTDPLEISPPPPARYAISDGEHLSVINTANKSFQKKYSERYKKHHQHLTEILHTNHIPLIEISTTQDVYQVLYQHLRER